MIRTASAADLALIRDILRRSNDAPYDIGLVAEEKCLGAGVSGATKIRLIDDVAVAVTCGKFLRLIAVDRDHRRRGLGTRLLRDSGAAVIGAEAGNYFTPGIADSDRASIEFFRAQGFAETAETWNLVAETPKDVAVTPEPPTPALIEFVRAHFGSIWAFEAGRARSAVYIRDAGFAVVEANNQGLGTFGPTGVKAGERGKGLGRALVLTAMQHLRALGFERVTIPWTDAIDFYRKTCAAEPTHRFVTMTRKL